MKRSKQATEVIVRKYHIRKDSADWDESCEEELRLQTQFWNRLVEIDHDNRQKYQGIMEEDVVIKELAEKINNLKERQAWLKTEQKKLNKKTHSYNSDCAEITSIHEMLKTCFLLMKELRVKAKNNKQNKISELETERYELVKAAYNASGLWWGNYNAVIDGYNTARSVSIKKGISLKEHIYNGSGTLTNSFTKGISVHELFQGEKSQAQMSPTVAGNYALADLSVTAFVRDKMRKQINYKIRYQRELPQENTTIKSIKIVRRLIAPNKIRKYAVFTLTKPKEEKLPPKNGKVTSIDIGWRRLDSGLRVATVLREGAVSDYVICPEEIVQGVLQVASLRAKRQKALSTIGRWLSNINWSTAPYEMQNIWEKIKVSSKIPDSDAWSIRAASDMDDLAFAWRNFPNYEAGYTYPLYFYNFKDEIYQDIITWLRTINIQKVKYLPNICEDAILTDIFTPYILMEVWRKYSKRLNIIALNLSDKMKNRRLWVYQNAALNIVKQSSAIILEEFDIAQAARLIKPDGQPTTQVQAMRFYRRVAAPAELRRWIEIKAREFGVPIIRHEGVSNYPHARCGVAHMVDNPKELYWHCPTCDVYYDVDENACCNMLIKYPKTAISG